MDVEMTGRDARGTDTVLAAPPFAGAPHSSAEPLTEGVTMPAQVAAAAASCWHVLRHTKYGLGVCLIVLVAIIWVGASQWIQHIFGELDFNKPYFLTFFNTTGFALWNFGFLASSTWRKVPILSDVGGPADERTCLHSSSGTDRAQETEEEPGFTITDGASAGASSTPQMYSWTKLARCALLFCPLWFLANVLFNYSLSLTSVASNTILSSTSSIWTLLLSRLILGSPIHYVKIIAVGLSVGGTALVALADSGTDSDGGAGRDDDGIAGDLLALVSAFFYAAYTTLLKWCLPDDELYHMGMVFGCVGVWNLIMFWPGLVLLDLIGVERFVFPTWGVLWPLLLNTLIGTNLSDVLWAKSIILTSPLVGTLGLSLTTPLAMISDAILKQKRFGVMYVAGALLVTTGFVVANLRR